MKLTADWLFSPGARRVCAVLEQGGHRVWFVGGCVRNAVLGAPATDVDLATDARPDRVTALAEAAGLRVVPTGIAHGTVTVLAEGSPFEVTTLRRDVETHGRRATVAFGGSLEEDAARRDFTMNALYAAPDGTVVDPVGGLADLRAGRVRFIGDPAARIREDALRILRFFRFHAWYGDPALGLDAEGYAACAEGIDLLDILSRERVGAEMRRLLAAPDPAPAVAAMARAGILARVLPGASDAGLAPLVHVEGRAGLAPDWIRRLAVLGATGPAEDLRLSRAESAQLNRLQAAIADGRSAGELGYRLGADAALSVLALRAALGREEIDPESAEMARFGAGQICPVVARDLMPGLSGPALGARLAELEARWIASGFRLGRAELLAGHTSGG
jgi:poly(A) polymerase